MGAFSDYATAMTRVCAATLESRRASLERSRIAHGRRAEQAAELRWEGEGGNTQRQDQTGVKARFPVSPLPL